MILRLLLLIALVYGGYRLSRWLRAAPPQQRRKRYGQVALITLAVIAVSLVAMGRLHWLGAIAVALLPLLQRIVLLALRLLPMAFPWLRRRFLQPDNDRNAQTNGQRHRQEYHGAADNGGALSRSDALAILGLPEHADREQILQAHRRLIQKLHPDRGGSDYLAARINAAKETLLRDTA